MSFSIGGIDLFLPAPRKAFEPGGLFDVILDRWPGALFQDADAEGVQPLDSVASLPSKEFFVYEDTTSAEDWARHGRTDEHANRMLHFLLDDDPDDPNLQRITLVVDALTPETLQLYGAIAAAAEDMIVGAESLGSGGRRVNLAEALRLAGARLSRAEFSDLVDGIRQAFYPAWTPDELACHPHDARQFCDVVRLKVGAPVPDSVIMRAVLNRGKRKGA